MDTLQRLGAFPPEIQHNDALIALYTDGPGLWWGQVLSDIPGSRLHELMHQNLAKDRVSLGLKYAQEALHNLAKYYGKSEPDYNVSLQPQPNNSTLKLHLAHRRAG